MRFKGTLTLLIIVVLFGGYIYFYEYKGGEKREAEKKAEKHIWRFEAEDIVHVELNTPKDRIIAERKENQWIITAPQTWNADAAEIGHMISSASTLNREIMVEQNAENLTQFGLQPANISLRMKAAEGKEYGIDFGIANPAGNATYAVLAGEKDVFLVSENAASSFNRKIVDLRDHTAFRFKRADVRALTLRNPKGTIELDKDKDDLWWFRGAGRREANGPEVRGILNALEMGKIVEFFDDNAEDYANASFDKPFIEAILTVGDTVRRFMIGTEKSKLKKKNAGKTGDAAEMFQERFLAKDAARAEVFFVDKTTVDKLLKSADDIREKALVSFQRWEIDAIALTNSKGTFNFTKLNGDWLQDGTKTKAKPDAVNGILDVLEKPVKEWIDAPGALSRYGVDPPLIRVALKKGAEVVAECAIGVPAKNGVYAKAGGDSSIKVADSEGLDLLDRGASDYFDF